MTHTRAQRGFTIVELLLVIVVIAILAAITVGTYTGIQDRARTSKINTDLASLKKAIMSARVTSGDVALRYVTQSTATAGNCVTTASSTDIADKTAATSCWNAYNLALDKISTASGVNVRNLADPWGRPYFIDENEREPSNGTCGGKDSVGTYPMPRIQNDWTYTNSIDIPYITC